jgi:hypothetical protein
LSDVMIMLTTPLVGGDENEYTPADAEAIT